MFHVKREHVTAANMPQPCATSKCLIYESGILLHNEAAISIEQTALHTNGRGSNMQKLS